MKKIISLILAALLMLTVFAGCGEKKNESDLEYIKEKGTLVVGITDYEPMDFEVDGKWTGFDAELAKLVAKELGVEVEFQLIEWTKKEGELAAKTIDCIWNGLTWDEERAEEMSLSEHYMKNKQAIVIDSKNKDKFKDAASLKNATFAAEGGSAGEDFVEANFPEATYVDKEGMKDVMTELLGGTSDAGVIDYIMANYLINKEGSDFASLMILETDVAAAEEYYSIAFRKGSDVTSKVDEILDTLRANGKVKEIADQYGLADALVD